MVMTDCSIVGGGGEIKWEDGNERASGRLVLLNEIIHQLTTYAVQQSMDTSCAFAALCSGVAAGEAYQVLYWASAGRDDAITNGYFAYYIVHTLMER